MKPGPDFRNGIKRLVKEGKLDFDKHKGVKLAGLETGGTVTGTFRRTSKGFGFVRPANTPNKADQIFIPIDAGRDASTGDEVTVKIVKKRQGRGDSTPKGGSSRSSRGPRACSSATTSRRTARATSRSTAPPSPNPSTSATRGPRGPGRGTRSPSRSPAIRRPIAAGKGSSPRSSAPGASPRSRPSPIIRALGIPDVFDDDTLDEARRQAKAFNEDDVADRLDLRDQLTVTIDPATARDFDDAITLSTRTRRGSGRSASTSPTSRTSSGRALRSTTRPGSGGPASTCPTA